ncbi:MAG: ABC-type transport system, permease component [Haloplasmataceae bacterium]|jgi:ABC-type sugar transport system permease subunit|nr:ABC-type transport system, permease component [Haloplasmataceae bacterium]
MSRRRHNLTVINNVNGYLFLLPWLIGFIVFTFGPFIYTFYLSFTSVESNTSGGFDIDWLGIKNYNELIDRDIPEFIPSIVNFVIMQALYVPVILVMSFILGLLLNQEIKFRTSFRTIFFLPVIILSGTVMNQFTSRGIGLTNFGEVNNNLIFKMIGNYTPFLTEGLQFIFNNFTMVLWFTGIPIVLFINALQKIDRQLFEAAQIDGANWWQMLWKITIPNIKSTAMIVSIYTIINLGLYSINARYNGIMNIFDILNRDLKNVTKGLGYASAEAALYSIVVLIFVLLVMVIFREKYKPKKFESLKERQIKNLQRIQQRNIRNEMTIKQFLMQIKDKFSKKGDKHSGK